MKTADGVLLLVEDRDDDVELMLRACRKTRLPARVEVVRDGAQALAYIQGDPPYHERVAFPSPSLVILDLKMPGLDGFEVLGQIRRRRESQALPVVVFSATNDERAVGRTFRLGATAYFVKPVSSRTFLKTFGEIEMFWKAMAR